MSVDVLSRMLLWCFVINYGLLLFWFVLMVLLTGPQLLTHLEC